MELRIGYCRGGNEDSRGVGRRRVFRSRTTKTKRNSSSDSNHNNHKNNDDDDDDSRPLLTEASFASITSTSSCGIGDDVLSDDGSSKSGESSVVRKGKKSVSFRLPSSSAATGANMKTAATKFLSPATTVPTYARSLWTGTIPFATYKRIDLDSMMDRPSSGAGGGLLWIVGTIPDDDPNHHHHHELTHHPHPQERHGDEADRQRSIVSPDDQGTKRKNDDDIDENGDDEIEKTEEEANEDAKEIRQVDTIETSAGLLVDSEQGVEVVFSSSSSNDDDDDVKDDDDTDTSSMCRQAVSCKILPTGIMPDDKEEQGPTEPHVSAVRKETHISNKDDQETMTRWMSTAILLCHTIGKIRIQAHCDPTRVDRCSIEAVLEEDTDETGFDATKSGAVDGTADASVAAEEGPEDQEHSVTESSEDTDADQEAEEEAQDAKTLPARTTSTLCRGVQERILHPRIARQEEEEVDCVLSDSSSIMLVVSESVCHPLLVEPSREPQLQGTDSSYDTVLFKNHGNDDYDDDEFAVVVALADGTACIPNTGALMNNRGSDKSWATNVHTLAILLLALQLALLRAGAR